MISIGVLRSVFERTPYGLPILVQVLHIFPQIGRKIKVKVSDSENITDAYLQMKNPLSTAVRTYYLLSISSLELRDSSQGKLLDINQFELLPFKSSIIGTPKIMTINYFELPNPKFCILQCINCLNIITHSKYQIKNLVFNYIQNCSIGIDSEILCECGTELGVRIAGLYSFEGNKVKICEFPELVLQDQSKILEVYEESIEKLKEQLDRLGKEYEERLLDIRNCLDIKMKKSEVCRDKC